MIEKCKHPNLNSDQAKKTFAPYAHFGIDFESFLQSLPSNHLKGLTLD